MTPDEREEYEENRADLIDNAHLGYQVTLGVDEAGSLRISGLLNNVVDFYGDFRSEIEEML